MKTQKTQRGATMMENMLVLAIGTAIAFPTFSMAGKSFKQFTQMNVTEVGQVAMEQNCSEIDSRYLLIEERLFDQSPLPTKNLVRALFALGHSREPSDIATLLRALAAWLAAPEQEEARRVSAAVRKRVRASMGPVIIPSPVASRDG